MGILNWLSKVGTKTGKLLQAGVGSAFKTAKWISKGVGKAESILDSALDLGSNIPVVRDGVELLRDNSIYKGFRGVVDDVRGVIESDSAQSIADHISGVDFSNHSVKEYAPAVRGVSEGIRGIKQSLTPASLNTRVGIPASSASSQFAKA